jgi:hypothetical protein
MSWPLPTSALMASSISRLTNNDGILSLLYMTTGFTNDFQKKALDEAAHKFLWWFCYTDDISVLWHHTSEKLESSWTTWLLSIKAFNSLQKCTDMDIFTALCPRFTGDMIAFWDTKFIKHPPTPTPTLTLHHKTTPPKSGKSSPPCYT